MVSPSLMRIIGSNGTLIVAVRRSVAGVRLGPASMPEPALVGKWPPVYGSKPQASYPPDARSHRRRAAGFCTRVHEFQRRSEGADRLTAVAERQAWPVLRPRGNGG